MLYNINGGKIVVMYVIWKKNMRKIKNFKEVSNVTLCAVVVESQRHNGNVKQKFVKYLGSIREDKIDSEKCTNLFWRKVSKNWCGDLYR